MVRFLHTADWQIGMTRHFLPDDAQARFTAARIDVIRRIGELAAEERCEFVVVCGDVFEANQLSRQTVGRALEALATIPVPVYLLPGNHDPLDPVTIYRSPQFLRDCPEHVRVLSSAEPVRVREGVELVPAPWFGKHPDSDLVGAAVTGALGAAPLTSAGSPGPPPAPAAAATGAVRIVVGHGAVDLLDPDRTNTAAILLEPLERELAAGRIHYVALGDRHSRTEVGGSGAVWYSGTPEVTSFREELPGEALVVDIEPGRAPSVTPHRVGTWTFQTLRRELVRSDDVAELGRELVAMPDKDRTVLRLALRGALAVADQATLTDLLDEQGEIFAALFLWERHSDLRVSADAEDLHDLNLSGFLSTAAEEMRRLAVTDVAESEATTPPDADAPAASVTAGRSDDPLSDDILSDDPLSWEFAADTTMDHRSATDGLALLYRLSREAVR